jgi:hypothetical protein
LKENENASMKIQNLEAEKEIFAALVSHFKNPCLFFFKEERRLNEFVESD